MCSNTYDALLAFLTCGSFPSPPDVDSQWWCTSPRLSLASLSHARERVSAFPLPACFHKAWKNSIVLRLIGIFIFLVVFSKDFQSYFQTDAGQVHRAMHLSWLSAKTTTGKWLEIPWFLHLDLLSQTFQSSAMLSMFWPLCNQLPLTIRKGNSMCKIQNFLSKHCVTKLKPFPTLKT